MTLILACLTKDAVFQLSDRRVTKFGNPAEVLCDQTNKAVFVNGRFVFGFAGRSHIGSELTSEWLAKVIASSPADDMRQVVELIRCRATEAFGQMAASLPPIQRLHAFQGVGWLRLRGETELTPAILTIHNAIDKNTGLWRSTPSITFKIDTEFPRLKGNDFILKSIGEQPHSGDKGSVFRLVQACIRHRRASPNTILQALIASMGWLAGRYPRIGAESTAFCLPKRAAEKSEQTRSIRMIAGAPAPDVATFVSVSRYGTTRYFGPNFVVGGNAFTNVECGSL